MKVDLHYGGGFVNLDIPEANICQIIRPWSNKQNTDNARILQETTARANGADFQRAIAGKRLGVLVPDGTRDLPLKDVFAQLFTLLKKASLVTLFICTGTHNANTGENSRLVEQIQTEAANAGLADFEIHIHDCQKDDFINAGKTSRGTDVIFGAKVDTSDIFLVLSDVKVHYFAGYSNPVKNFVPGLCAFATAEHNHSLALDESSTFGLHPWHSDPAKRDQPLAADQIEAMEMIVKGRPVYALVTISSSGKIHWARLGPVRKVTAEAFDIADKRNTHAAEPVKRLIVSPGPPPNDVNLYIAQRALELTKQAVTDGGEILFLAACPKGIGEQHTIENFYNRLTKPVDEILRSIEGEYKLFSHKPYKFARMIKRLGKIRIYSQIPDELIEAAHLWPTHDPQKVVDGWLGEEADTKITVVDGANKLALYTKKKFSK
ncbi:MAG: lactate racemase domain-containing protein [Planctomycetota bacterium]|jgi:nickel-dependent lactate racemase